MTGLISFHIEKEFCSVGFFHKGIWIEHIGTTINFQQPDMNRNIRGLEIHDGHY